MVSTLGKKKQKLNLTKLSILRTIDVHCHRRLSFYRFIIFRQLSMLNKVCRSWGFTGIQANSTAYDAHGYKGHPRTAVRPAKVMPNSDSVSDSELPTDSNSGSDCLALAPTPAPCPDKLRLRLRLRLWLRSQTPNAACHTLSPVGQITEGYQLVDQLNPLFQLQASYCRNCFCSATVMPGSQMVSHV